MQASNDWPIDEPFGGPGLSPCVVPICEHSVDFYECEICFKNSPIQKQKIQKQKTKIEKLIKILSFPIYFIGLLITGIFVGIRFFFEEGYESLVGFLILGWVISAIYHLFFTFIPFLFNLFF